MHDDNTKDNFKININYSTNRQKRIKMYNNILLMNADYTWSASILVI